jgi:hypothetical protein
VRLRIRRSRDPDRRQVDEFDRDRLGGVLRQVLGVGRNDCHDLALHHQVGAHRVRGGRVAVGQDERHSGHLLGLAGVEMADCGARIGATQELGVEHAWQADARRIFGGAAISRLDDLAQRSLGPADDGEIDGRMALPFAGDDLGVAFDERVTGTVAAAGGKIAHRRKADDLGVFQRRFDLHGHRVASPRR